MKKFLKNFKKWEVLLVYLASFIATAAIILLYTGIPYWNEMFGIENHQVRDVVGVLDQKQGSLKRQFFGDKQFGETPLKSSLYDGDTLVTGDGSSAVITLNDGSRIEMSPFSMVRLVFDQSYSLGGIERFAKLEVFSGKVKGKSSGVKLIVASSKKVMEIQPNEAVLISSEKDKEPQVQMLGENDQPVTPEPTPTESLAATPSPSPTESVVAEASPSPSPSTTIVSKNEKIKITSIKPSAKLAVAKDSEKPEVTLPITWQSEPKNLPVTVKVFRIESQKSKDEVFSKDFDEPTFNPKTSSVLDRPGVYELSIQSKSNPATKSETRFLVEQQFQGIQVQEPLVGGKKASSNTYQGQKADKFDITLNWKPYPGVKKYRVKILNPTTKGVLLAKELDEPNYLLNKDKVFSGQIMYQISAQTNKGFLVTSSDQIFIFNFFAPNLVLPEDKAVWMPEIPQTPGEDTNVIIFTWQKTNFTDHYEFQIASDAQFTKIIDSQMHNENFFMHKAPTPGVYFWRVKSFSKTFSSGWSKVNQLTVKARK